MTALTTTPELPPLDDDYALPDGAAQAYRQHGHVQLRAVASPSEVASYEPHISEAVRRHRTESRPLEERDTYGRAFLQVWELKESDEVTRRYVLSRRFAKIAADLMGVSGVRIFNDQALFKEPGGGHTPWHQDHPYWPVDTDDMVTMWMPLVDMTPGMGSLEFASGSHASGPIDAFDPTDVNAAISDHTDSVLARHIHDRQLTTVSSGVMAAGDATFHNGWTLHRAEANATDAMRKVMTVIYMADGATTLQATNPGAQEAYEVEFLGLSPGDPAAGPRNPLVFARDAD